MVTFDQVLQLFDHVGLCGLTFLLLVFHMVQEERSRRFFLAKNSRPKTGG